MERLTDKHEADAQRKEYERRLANGYPRNIPEERFLRLAAYEDTHMMPADVMSMRMDMAIITALLHDCDVDRMRELTEADKDGRLAVLPCKVGQRVFALLNTLKHISECEVKRIRMGDHFGFAVIEPISACGHEYSVSLKGFGKTVFLTREEAEKALEAEVAE